MLVMITRSRRMRQTREEEQLRESSASKGLNQRVAVLEDCLCQHQTTTIIIRMVCPPSLHHLLITQVFLLLQQPTTKINNNNNNNRGLYQAFRHTGNLKNSKELPDKMLVDTENRSCHLQTLLDHHLCHQHQHHHHPRQDCLSTL